jgi:hypothetical protein
LADVCGEGGVYYHTLACNGAQGGAQIITESCPREHS